MCNLLTHCDFKVAVPTFTQIYNGTEGPNTCDENFNQRTVFCCEICLLEDIGPELGVQLSA